MTPSRTLEEVHDPREEFASRGVGQVLVRGTGNDPGLRPRRALAQHFEVRGGSAFVLLAGHEQKAGWRQFGHVIVRARIRTSAAQKLSPQKTTDEARADRARRRIQRRIDVLELCVSRVCVSSIVAKAGPPVPQSVVPSRVTCARATACLDDLQEDAMDDTRDSHPEGALRTRVLLDRAAQGDTGADRELLAVVYDELHALARKLMARERDDHTLQPTALVHEAFVRLLEGTGETWNDRTHFFRVAARAMRHVLVDHERRRGRDKRGGAFVRRELTEAGFGSDPNLLDLLVLNDALERLAEVDAFLARVVELRFFGGFTQGEIAHMEDVSTRTIERGWLLARAWLYQAIQGDGPAPS